MTFTPSLKVKKRADITGNRIPDKIIISQPVISAHFIPEKIAVSLSSYFDAIERVLEKEDTYSNPATKFKAS